MKLTKNQAILCAVATHEKMETFCLGNEVSQCNDFTVTLAQALSLMPVEHITSILDAFIVEYKLIGGEKANITIKTIC